MVRKKISTNNREIYEGFSNLKLGSCSEIRLKNVTPIQVERIIRDVNKHSTILDMKVLDNEILIKKMLPVNFDVYIRRKINRII